MVIASDSQDELDRQYRAVLTERLQRLETMASSLAAERSQIEERLAKISEEVSHLRALLGNERRTESATFPAKRVATATDVVHLLERVGTPLHYRAIERHLREAGFDTGGGSDPANALLAKEYNDNRLYRPARGIYDLRSRAGAKNVKSVGERRRGRK